MLIHARSFILLTTFASIAASVSGCDDESASEDAREMEADATATTGVDDDGEAQQPGDVETTGTPETTDTGTGESTGGLAGTEDTGDANGIDTGEDTETDGEAQPEDAAPLDHDSPTSPAVRAQFRNTAAGPVLVDGPLFNEEPIDTRGLLYTDRVSRPGDDEDWIEFTIIPGENDPTLGFGLTCDIADAEPQPLRAHLLTEDGQVLRTVVCGQDPANVFLPGANGQVYRVQVELLDTSAAFTRYELSLDAYCFQGCDYAPY